MATGTELTMKHLRPFNGRVTVVESMVDEAQRDSGIIVPITGEGSQSALKRGIVLDVAGSPHVADSDLLGRGTVVFYLRGWSIGDVIVVDLQDIVAYEDSNA